MDMDSIVLESSMFEHLFTWRMKGIYRLFILIDYFGSIYSDDNRKKYPLISGIEGEQRVD